MSSRSRWSVQARGTGGPDDSDGRRRSSGRRRFMPKAEPGARRLSLVR
jgi:hypothetical protein